MKNISICVTGSIKYVELVPLEATTAFSSSREERDMQRKRERDKRGLERGGGEIGRNRRRKRKTEVDKQSEEERGR